MGFSPSPYYAVTFYYLALEFVLGNRKDKGKFFRWDSVKLNLPGSTTFNPGLPWAMQWNDLIKNIAAAVVAFVDDLRISGIDEETAWRAGRQLASRLQYLGLQDAARKTKPPCR